MHPPSRFAFKQFREYCIIGTMATAASLSSDGEQFLEFCRVEKGLAANSLDDRQWAALQTALAAKGAAYAAAQKGSQLVRLTQTGKDVTEYSFSYYPGGNDPAVVFTLTSGVVYKPTEELPRPAGSPPKP